MQEAFVAYQHKHYLGDAINSAGTLSLNYVLGQIRLKAEVYLSERDLTSRWPF